MQELKELNVKELEKSIKKNKIALTFLIIIFVLLALYVIIVLGDLSSTKQIIGRKEYDAQMTELQEQVTALDEDVTKAEEKIQGYFEDLEENQATLTALQADLEAINNGTYTED